MPLVELKETLPPYGFTVMKNANIMENACKNIQEHMRAPLIITESKKTLVENFVSNTDDTWLSFNSDLIAKSIDSGLISFPYYDAQYLHPDYDGTMTIVKAYEYLKTLPEFEGAEDV